MFFFKKHPKKLTVEAAVQVLQSRAKRVRWTERGVNYRGEFDYAIVTTRDKFRLVLSSVERMEAGADRYRLFDPWGVTIEIPVTEITVELANDQLMFIDWADRLYFTVDLKG